MKVGITYDLRDDYLRAGYGVEETAEFDREDTIHAIETSLEDLGYEPVRIGNVKALVQRLNDGDRWDLVCNIAEGLHGYGREAQVPAILDAYDIPYTFSDPLVLSLTLHKGMVKHVVRDIDIPTPDFCVVASPSDVSSVNLSFPLFAKPVAEGTGKGIDSASKIIDRQSLESVCRRMLRDYRQPVLVEAFLPGREFTVGILGTGENAVSIGVIEVLLRENAEADVYSYQNKEHFKERVEYLLVNDETAKRAEETALAAWRGLGCRDGGRVDLRADAAGIPNFMEVNPLAGLHPENSDLCIIASMTGMSYGVLIEAIMQSALKRCNGEGKV
ncbi:MAG: D-alanine--D-alanine ligase [Deltaproteobacteria bacterium]|nr:D-alanine--D-alanine ligase [Deltaproteobacteria bacterium]